jgi:hypothetical protein
MELHTLMYLLGMVLRDKDIFNLSLEKRKRSMDNV